MTEIKTIMVGDIEIPKNMHLLEKTSRLEFEYSWYKFKYVITMIVVPFIAFFLVESDYIIGDFNTITIPVAVVVIFAAVALYFSLAKLINTTKIRVTHNAIEVKNGPLPYSKNLMLKKEDVTQFYVTQHRIGHRYYLFATTYQINIILKSDKVITLVKGLYTPKQGRFIENKIEDFLGITDIHVDGELAKD